MYLSYYALEKMVEMRLSERREEAARERAIAPGESPIQREPARAHRWFLVQILGR